jgi:hypothetical protein
MRLQLIIETARRLTKPIKMGDSYKEMPLGRRVPTIATEIKSAISDIANFTDVRVLRSGFMKICFGLDD